MKLGKLNLPSVHVLLVRYATIRRRYRLAALVALPLLLCGTAYAVALAGQQEERAQLQASVDEGARQRDERLAYLGRGKAWSQRVRDLEGQLRLAHLALPDDPEVPQFLAQLGTMAHDVGLSIERFVPKPEVVRDFYAELGFTVQVRGTFHQVAMLLAQVGAMERIVTVTNLSLTQKAAELSKDKDRTESVGKGEVDGSFEVTVYRLLRDDELATANGKKDGH